MRIHGLLLLLLVALAAPACGDDAPLYYGNGGATDAGAGGQATCVAGTTLLCACSTGSTGAQVCESDGSAFSACDCSSGAQVSGVAVAVADADQQDVIGLVATHTIGETDCQQILGAITLTNEADAAAEVKVEDEQVVRIAVGRFQGALTLSGPNLELRAGDGRRFPVSGPIVLAADATGIRLAGRRIDAELLRRVDGVLGPGRTSLARL
jgi:hypothetical protein